MVLMIHPHLLTIVSWWLQCLSLEFCAGQLVCWRELFNEKSCVYSPLIRPGHLGTFWMELTGLLYPQHDLFLTPGRPQRNLRRSHRPGSKVEEERMGKFIARALHTQHAHRVIKNRSLSCVLQLQRVWLFMTFQSFSSLLQKGAHELCIPSWEKDKIK